MIVRKERLFVTSRERSCEASVNISAVDIARVGAQRAAIGTPGGD
jgi:hypothetical protein